jgi:hypothetical protein
MGVNRPCDTALGPCDTALITYRWRSSQIGTFLIIDVTSLVRLAFSASSFSPKDDKESDQTIVANLSVCLRDFMIVPT